MIIQIDEKTRIKGTKNCWELQRPRSRNGVLSWEPDKWFTSFGRAVEHAINREIRLHPASTLIEALHAVSEVLQRFNALIPDQFEVRIKEKDDDR